MQYYVSTTTDQCPICEKNTGVPLPSLPLPLSPLPSLPSLSLPLPPFLFPPFPFWGSAVSSASEVWGGATAEVEFGAF